MLLSFIAKELKEGKQDQHMSKLLECLSAKVQSSTEDSDIRRDKGANMPMIYLILEDPGEIYFIHSALNILF